MSFISSSVLDICWSGAIQFKVMADPVEPAEEEVEGIMGCFPMGSVKSIEGSCKRPVILLVSESKGRRFPYTHAAHAQTFSKSWE